MVGVPWNARVALGSVCIKREEQAQSERKNRQQEGCEPQRHHANASRPKQEIISGERGDRWEKEDNEFGWHCERANERAASIEQKNDRDVDDDDANNACHEWRKAQSGRRRIGTSGAHRLTRIRLQLAIYFCSIEAVCRKTLQADKPASLAGSFISDRH